MTASSASAIILAAGYSSRMGTLKPLLEVGGVPALSRVVSAFQAALGASGEIIVVTGHERERLRPLLSGVREVCNANYADGMLSSVKAGVAACSGAYALVCPADCALISAELVAAVLTEPAKIVIPCYRGEEGHPLKIGAELFAGILGYDGSTGPGLRGYLSTLEHEIARLDVPFEGAVLDMDTPDDYEMLNAKC